MRTKRLLAALAAAALLAAGCGGGSSDGDDSDGGSGEAAASSSNRAVEYSQCMRENGVPDFPDPVDGRLQLRAGPGGIDPKSPGFKAAREACQELAPQGRTVDPERQDQMQDQVLKFAHCMRENGVPSFPDPDISGGGVKMQLPPGVDPSSPQFKSAQEACGSLLAELGGAP